VIRTLLRLSLTPAGPAPLVRGFAGEILTPFGRWLRERVASAAVDWPDVAFHRVHLTATSLEVVVLLRPGIPPHRGAQEVARALARELDLAAQRTGWSRGVLWSDVALWTGDEVGSAARASQQYHGQGEEDRVH
jgi:hypothetical protein